MQAAHVPPWSLELSPCLRTTGRACYHSSLTPIIMKSRCTHYHLTMGLQRIGNITISFSLAFLWFRAQILVVNKFVPWRQPLHSKICPGTRLAVVAKVGTDNVPRVPTWILTVFQMILWVGDVPLQTYTSRREVSQERVSLSTLTLTKNSKSEFRGLLINFPWQSSKYLQTFHVSRR